MRRRTVEDILLEERERQLAEVVSLDDERGRYLEPTQVRLVLELHARGLTQPQIAGKVGCAQSTVSRVLKGEGSYQYPPGHPFAQGRAVSGDDRGIRGGGQ